MRMIAAGLDGLACKAGGEELAVAGAVVGQGTSEGELIRGQPFELEFDTGGARLRRAADVEGVVSVSSCYT